MSDTRKPTSKRTPTPRDEAWGPDWADPDTATIIIERREVVAQIIPSLDATMPMVQAAFARAAEYMAEHDAEPVRLEFRYAGFRFTAAQEPDTTNDGSTR